MVQETERLTVENANVVGPNVISFQSLARKEEQWHVIGCHFPLSNK